MTTTPTPFAALAAAFAVAASPAFAGGDPQAGRALYQARCSACHALDFNGVGPAHRGVYGRPAGLAKGYTYSPALAASKLTWTDETLDRWLADPESTVPGQRMGFNVPDAQERADVIAYLKQESTPK